MHIAICYNNMASFTLPYLIKDFERAGHSCEVVVSLDQVIDNPHRFDVGILRIFDSESLELGGRMAACYLEKCGVPFLESTNTQSITRSKHASHLLFAAAEILQPKWQLCKGSEVIEDYWTEPKAPFYAKIDTGGEGNNIFYTDSREEAMSYFKESEIWILQQAIKPANLWRTITSREGVVIGYKKSLLDQEQKIASITQGASRVYSSYDHLEEISVAMLSAVGGRLMGTDIIEDQEGRLFALEINLGFGFDISDAKRKTVTDAILNNLREVSGG